jgi:hypothetical protein
MTAAWLARFAAEAFAALQEREPDPIEDAERAAWQLEKPLPKEARK